MEIPQEFKEFENCEACKEIQILSENMVCVRLKNSRHLMFDLDNWKVSKITDYQYTDIYFKRE